MLREASQIGRLLAPPFGDGGLKVDGAREFVALLGNAPVGDGVGVVIAGPMDQAPPKSADVLLKRIEEFDEQVVYPLLWANDLGGVQWTIRSRCLDRWCPEGQPDDPEQTDHIEKAAYSLIAAAVDGKEPWKIPGLVASMKDQLPELLGALSDALLPKMDDPASRKLWDRLRRVAQWWRPTVPELVSALFPEGDR